jgi:hypothetical protein
MKAESNRGGKARVKAARMKGKPLYLECFYFILHPCSYPFLLISFPAGIN